MTCKRHRQPLYDQLVDILIEKIDHEYQPGDLIPSERELAERYGLSRSTVRLAIQELEYLGRIVRKQGRGTFVADRLAQATNLTQSYSSVKWKQIKRSRCKWGFVWVKKY